VLAGAAVGYAAGGYLVMLDGITGPGFLDPFRARRDAPLHYAVLRPERPETLRRAHGRTGRERAPVRAGPGIS
jgi:hypothetical protein